MDVDDEASIAGADRSGSRKRFEVKKARILMRRILLPYLYLYTKLNSADWFNHFLRHPSEQQEAHCIVLYCIPLLYKLTERLNSWSRAVQWRRKQTRIGMASLPSPPLLLLTSSLSSFASLPSFFRFSSLSLLFTPLSPPLSLEVGPLKSS